MRLIRPWRHRRKLPKGQNLVVDALRGEQGRYAVQRLRMALKNGAGAEVYDRGSLRGTSLSFSTR